MTRVVASIEARMASSRLPGKMLMDVGGQPAISRLLRRLRQCKRLDEIVLATARSVSCDRLESWAVGEKLPCYRGDEDDVLQRVVNAQKSVQSDVVVEINGDCILLDPEIVDQGIETFLENDVDVVSNCRKPGYPLGFGVQVFRLDALEHVARNISDPLVREHVSLYFYEHPELYRIIHMFPPERLRLPHARFQLDYQEDLDLIRAIYAELEPAHGDSFGLPEIIELLKVQPDLRTLNGKCKDKDVRV
jgi:spore coat polysaccharide biosynthesis protein SpsF